MSGLIYIFTGEGKGKTSAALGMTVRALIHGWKVGWISWYKQKSWGISEHELSKICIPATAARLTFLPMGKGFYLKKSSITGVKTIQAGNTVIVDTATRFEHKKVALNALNTAQNLMKKVDVLVLDEVCNAIADGLLDEKQVLQVLEKRRKVHLVLTGRNAPARLVNAADLVSTIQNVKHPFEQGISAVKGLDF